MEKITQKSNRFAFLNFLKFVAAFSVFLQHIGSITQKGSELINSSGFLSFSKVALCPVMFFFLVSGLLFRQFYYSRIKDGSLAVKQFFVNRLIKIYPLMIITTIIFFILSFICFYGYDLNLPRGSTRFIDLLLGCLIGGDAVFTGTFSKLNGVLWYIGVLLICYIVSVVIVKKSKSRIVFLIPIIIGFAMYFYGENIPFFNKLVGTGLINFFMGFYVADFLDYLMANKKQNVCFSCASVAVIASFLFMYFFFYVEKQSFSLLDYSSCGVVNILLWIPLMIIFQNLNFFNKVCDLKPVKFVFNLNYDFFMWHLIALSIVWMVIMYNKFYTIDRVLMFFICLGSSLLLAAFSNLFISKPIDKLLKKLIIKKQK